MASKIQVKRGNKADLPILSDGEYGFCQDTSEIFIGNGGTNIKIYPTTSLDASSVTVEDIENIFESVNVEGVLSELGESILDILNGITTVGKASDANTVGGFTVAKNVPSDAKFTDTTYTEITTAEIDAGTASTLRTITARRLKYLLDKIVALFPTKVSELTNDSGFLSELPTSLPANGGNADTVGGFTVGVDVPANAKFTDTDTVYTHPTTAGNKHIPTGGTVGQILKNTASGTATWQDENETTIANNLIETIAGKALDATQGKILSDDLVAHKAEMATQEDLGHVKLQETWITATLKNGWTGTLQYAKNDLGQVFLKGEITPGTITKGTTITTLPSGYRVSSDVPDVPFLVHETYYGRGVLGLTLLSNGAIMVYSPADTTLSDRAIRINATYSVL